MPGQQGGGLWSRELDVARSDQLAQAVKHFVTEPRKRLTRSGHAAAEALTRLGLAADTIATLTGTIPEP